MPFNSRSIPIEGIKEHTKNAYDKGRIYALGLWGRFEDMRIGFFYSENPAARGIGSTEILRNRNKTRVTATLILLALSIFSLLSAFSLFGCAKTAQNELFFYRNENIKAEISLTCNGTSSRFTYERLEDTSKVTFSLPQELTGFTLELTAEGAYVLYGDLKTDAPEALTLIPELVGEIFAVAPDQISAVETLESFEGSEKTILTRLVTSTCSVTIDENGIPVSAEGMISGAVFSMEIENFTVIPR